MSRSFRALCAHVAMFICCLLLIIPSDSMAVGDKTDVFGYGRVKIMWGTTNLYNAYFEDLAAASDAALDIS